MPDESGNVNVLLVFEFGLSIKKEPVPVELALNEIFVIAFLHYTIVHVDPSGTVTITPLFIAIGPALKAFLFSVIV